jgi:hypothetical protein
MAATRLSVYNGALRLLGERDLASLTENREPRRLCDSVWNDGLLRYCLEHGAWHFAMRSAQIEYSPSIEPPFGFTRAFEKSSDWVKTHSVCTDEYYRSPLLEFDDNQQKLFADWDVLYVKFVSDREDFGGDFSLWPESFNKWVQARLALEIGPRLTVSENRMVALKKQVEDLLHDAQAKDAVQGPSKMFPHGSFIRARQRSRVRSNGSSSWGNW